jgi:hypothetical protein
LTNLFAFSRNEKNSVPFGRFIAVTMNTFLILDVSQLALAGKIHIEVMKTLLNLKDIIHMEFTKTLLNLEGIIHGIHSKIWIWLSYYRDYRD